MEQALWIYNTLSRRKEVFKPLHAPNVGMYVCGPTVYGDPHLGHARPAITFDILFRYLKHLGYKVRYVRNITDVGHLEHDADEGDDKIEKKARLEQLEPMEIAQYYTNRYHAAMEALNVLPPSIEPHATGHIIEQEQLVQQILDNGFAYESNGSVYFDVKKYNEKHHYGILSGRNLDDVKDASRALDGVGEKRNQADFALWKKASPEHIMRWPSPWSDGFPGWHCECTAMGRKYLGAHFDIHGGGMDLVFPHHECEIAQAVASQGDQMVHYWMHNNMITINGQKMGKSLGNFITLPQLFAGEHDKLEQAYSPMTVRFFILQAHYRSTLDFSNDALKAAEKGYRRVMQAAQDLRTIASAAGVNVDVRGTEGDAANALKYGEFLADVAPETCPADSEAVKAIFEGVYAALCDDLNTSVALSHIFEAVKLINTEKEKKGSLTKGDIETLLRLFDDIVYGVLGLVDESGDSGKSGKTIAGLMDMVIEERAKAKASKDWATSDSIRDHLKALGIVVKDTKDGVEWTLE